MPASKTYFRDHENIDEYGKCIASALDRAYASDSCLDLQRNPDEIRMVIFSDQHRGKLDRADDFRLCLGAYHAALAYYIEAGFEVIILGDAEEFWENSWRLNAWEKIRKAHESSLQMEAELHRQGRYFRVYGNHDFPWEKPENVKAKLCDRLFEENLRVYEGIRLRIVREEQELGTIFLVHGHQGTFNSDEWSKVSKRIVRYLWGPIQRLTGFQWRTPAQNSNIRRKHENAMYDWARHQERVVLITGHTHRPIFEARTHVQSLKHGLEKLRRDFAAGNSTLDSIARKRAELEWIQALHDIDNEQSAVESKPCYFNAGCCVFPDGDITAIEVADREIRLVRWPDNHASPLPEKLASAKLTNVLKQVK